MSDIYNDNRLYSRKLTLKFESEPIQCVDGIVERCKEVPIKQQNLPIMFQRRVGFSRRSIRFKSYLPGLFGAVVVAVYPLRSAANTGKV